MLKKGVDIKKSVEEKMKDEEERAQRIITYMALEAERKKQKKKLDKAIQDNKDGYLDDYIAMQKNIIKKIEDAMR